MMETLKPMRSDLLVVAKDDMQESKIITTLKKKEKGIVWFDVAAIGDKVTEIQVGDIIGVKYADHTTPFLVDGKYYCITDESKVLVVLDAST